MQRMIYFKRYPSRVQGNQKTILGKELSVLMMAYRDAPTKSVKLQILGLYAYRFSTEKLMRYHELYEPLTRWQINQATSIKMWLMVQE